MSPLGVVVAKEIRFTLPDGTTAIREGRPGEVSYSGLTSHASENVGDVDAQGIIVELKSQAAASD